MKTIYPIYIIDLGLQIEHVTPKKIEFFEEYYEAPANTILYTISIKHRKIKMTPDGNKNIGIELI